MVCLNRQIFNLFLQTPLTLVLCVSLFGCGGDDSADSTGQLYSTESTIISGTAATGMPITGFVYVTDSNGTTVNSPIDSVGNYTVDVENMRSPYLLSAVPNDTSMQTQYSYTKRPGIVNITPLTSLALFYAAEIDGAEQDLSVLASNWASMYYTVFSYTIHESPSLAKAQAVINANFANQFTAQGLDANTFNIFSGSFKADNTGFDALLDQLDFHFDFTNMIVSMSVMAAPAFVFDKDIDLSSSNISGIKIGNASGSITFSGTGIINLISTTFTPVFYVEYPLTEGSTPPNSYLIVWTGNDNVTVTLSVINNVLSGVRVDSPMVGYSSSNVWGGSGTFNGTVLTFLDNTFAQAAGSALSWGDLVINGSLSK